MFDLEENMVDGVDTNCQLRTKLTELIEALPQSLRDKFDSVEIFPGLLSFKHFSQDLHESVPEHNIYSTWFREHMKNKGSMECNRKFSELFENLQVRSSSEAIVETVGSIMVNNIGKGRYLNAHNFNKEIYLEYNLGPQVGYISLSVRL